MSVRFCQMEMYGHDEHHVKSIAFAYSVPMEGIQGGNGVRRRGQ